MAVISTTVSTPFSFFSAHQVSAFCPELMERYILPVSGQSRKYFNDTGIAPYQHFMDALCKSKIAFEGKGPSLIITILSAFLIAVEMEAIG